MPKVGVEPIRKAALVKAAIAEVAGAGSLEVTMAQVARSAGMSAPLAHHYFGGKDALFEAAMRAILRDYARSVRAELGRAEGPRARVEAILHASFAAPNFAPDTIAAWLVFYVQAQRNPAFRRLLRVYHRRLRSNLLENLRPLLGVHAPDAAEALGAMIDGQYLRSALSESAPAPHAAEAAARGYLDLLLTQGRP
ncbi:MAG: transcriptional regulator BetI [Pseudomonadota bacterium]